MATIARKSSAPAPAKGRFDAEVDVITVGSGVAGLADRFVQRLAREQSPRSREGIATRRHNAEGRILVLGAEQRGDAQAAV